MSAQTPSNAAFTVENGSSFSASPAGRNVDKQVDAVAVAGARITDDVRQALQIIRENHIAGPNVDSQSVVKSSINSMLAELDPHSNYLDAAEFAELLGEHESEYSGTGSSISNFIRDGRIETYIVATHNGSAAARAGLRFGDRLVAIEGKPLTGVPVDVVRDRIRGPRGTTVRVAIERAATGKTEIVELRRERVSQPSISSVTMVDGDVGYIGLTNGFSSTTTAEFSSAIIELHGRGMRSLVIDLRGNGGGILEQAIAIAEKFLPSGRAIISQRGRHRFDDRGWKSGNRHPENLPLVILVDGQTASASEIVAGALQDNDRALIVGENTFGKGLVQNVVELPMGTGLTLTTARYYTPSGRSLQRAYDSGNRHDYFSNRATTPSTADTRTVTNRPVSSGQGITPDEAVAKQRFSLTRSMLIDPVFFFVRDLTAKGESRAIAESIDTSDRLPNELVERFRLYLQASIAWRLPDDALQTEYAFVEKQLRYQLALSAAGADRAEQVMVRFDEQVKQAVRAIPEAARLAESARVLRPIVPVNKKARRVAYPAGQVRNRRN